MKKCRLMLALALLCAVALTGAASAATVVVDTTVYKSGVLRAEPDLDADILGYIRNGESVTIVEDLGSWYAVETADGTDGYMHESIISLADAATDMKAIKQVGNIRAGESVDSEYVRGLDAGTNVLVINRGISWTKVVYNGKTGYSHNTVFDYEAE